MKPLSLRVFGVKTKIQSFVGFLEDSTHLYLMMKMSVVGRLTYIGSEIHNSFSCEAKVLKIYRPSSAVVDLLGQDCLALLISMRNNEGPDL